eukprot:3370227-Amphidinium_carterae.1
MTCAMFAKQNYIYICVCAVFRAAWIITRVDATLKRHTWPAATSSRGAACLKQKWLQQEVSRANVIRAPMHAVISSLITSLIPQSPDVFICNAIACRGRMIL